ncbi:uncharacterized protein BDW43DRAFT_321540 [Aspergillus alliaceus]|uniref:uncharacterized protein n=1 Tax=Petromyces alliaceus TaxID=209559 RepID=UPI0012A5B600|nr:uncharacterized protein BDW43DRAFT_321540 [Aspergillus alliaceus]KAB8230427.1 hypothetical protein BDW43DRAFT_321540 [Aspergillus alliaceus]
MASISHVVYTLLLMWLVGLNFTTASPTNVARPETSDNTYAPADSSGNDFIVDYPQSIEPGDRRKPIYAIAHRVLTVKGVSHAISHGANAIEIDMVAWRKGWWADHDGTPTSYGDTAKEMFMEIGRQRDARKTINFVWLDIKNPDYCPPNDKWRHCSVELLRDLVRQILEPKGVRVLYGFYSANSRAYDLISQSLNTNEAINLNGRVRKVLDEFEKHGPPQVAKRVMSYGYFNLPFQFGNCQEDRYYTCTELRQLTQSKGSGAVFGWTSAMGEDQYVDKLLGTAGVDGLIYGFKMTHYYDHSRTRAAAQDLIRWVRDHPDTHRMGTQDDNPW